MVELAQVPSQQVQPTPRRVVMENLGAYLLPSLIAALVAGFLIAGVGARLAMLLLRVTSGDHVVGLESDEGFVIGRFTSSTFFLVLALTVGSAAVLGPASALVRFWIPAGWRSPVLALHEQQQALQAIRAAMNQLREVRRHHDESSRQSAALVPSILDGAFRGQF